MEPYRYQQMAYLIVPVFLGMELFLTAKEERGEKAGASLGSFLLDFFGILFMAILPAVFIFTIWAKTTDAFSVTFSWKDTIERMDRYIVMFFFLGAWWQVYMIGALRARRLKHGGRNWHVLLPFLALGVFISLLVLWVSPFGLKWISIGWFIFLSSVLFLFNVRPAFMEKVFWALSAITFFFMNMLFIWLDAVV